MGAISIFISPLQYILERITNPPSHSVGLPYVERYDNFPLLITNEMSGIISSFMQREFPDYLLEHRSRQF